MKTEDALEIAEVTSFCNLTVGGTCESPSEDHSEREPGRASELERRGTDGFLDEARDDRLLKLEVLWASAGKG